MIFSKDHIEQIIQGQKTQTRRVGKKRWSPGKEYSARTNRFRKAEHYIRILSIYRQQLLDISRHDAKQEGGYYPHQFMKLFCEMHKKKTVHNYSWVWVIHFVYIGTKKTEI